VTVGVAHVCRSLAMETPPDIRAVLAEDGTASKLVASLEPSSVGQGGPMGPRRRLASLLWGFATEENGWLGFRHAATRFFRPGPEDWAAVALPPGFQWLYYPLRPPRLAGKWLVSAFQERRGGEAAHRDCSKLHR